MLPLSRLPLGRTARVMELNASRPVDQRLLALGLVPGMRVKLVRVAPLGVPIAIEFHNQCVSLRRAEAAGILVEAEPATRAERGTGRD